MHAHIWTHFHLILKEHRVGRPLFLLWFAWGNGGRKRWSYCLKPPAGFEPRRTGSRVYLLITSCGLVTTWGTLGNLWICIPSTRVLFPAAVPKGGLGLTRLSAAGLRLLAAPHPWCGGATLELGKCPRVMQDQVLGMSTKMPKGPL